MKNVMFKTIALLLIAAVIFTACQKESIKKTAETQQTETQQLFAPLDIDGVTSRSACPWAVIPAGSVDVLQQAINDICEEGVIYLKAGIHTENNTININKPVKIIGETDAVLRIQSPALQLGSDGTLLAMTPALHVLNAPNTLIQDLTVQPLGTEGGAAIVFENSPGSAAMRNNMSGFQSNILIEQSDRVTVMFNKIVSRTPWGLSMQPVAFGILNVNGKSTYISDNDISGALWAIFVSDLWGTIERNNLHDNNFGINVCGFRAAYTLPNGTIPAKVESAGGWKVRNNTITDNMNTGILVIDGSHNNILENNNLSGNNVQDVELTSTTSRNGFVAEASFDNTVIAGSYGTILIKDCGDNNTIVGGVLVDTAATPCF